MPYIPGATNRTELNGNGRAWQGEVKQGKKRYDKLKPGKVRYARSQYARTSKARVLGECPAVAVCTSTEYYCKVGKVTQGNAVMLLRLFSAPNDVNLKTNVNHDGD